VVLLDVYATLVNGRCNPTTPHLFGGKQNAKPK
jgi:hypothetical protein